MIRENQEFLNRISILLDGILVFCSFLLGYGVRFHVLPGGIPVMSFRAYVIVALFLVPLHLLTYGVMELYDSHRKKRLYQELGKLFWANTLDFIILQMGFFLLKDVHFSRLALLLFLTKSEPM